MESTSTSADINIYFWLLNSQRIICSKNLKKNNFLNQRNYVITELDYKWSHWSSRTQFTLHRCWRELQLLLTLTFTSDTWIVSPQNTRAKSKGQVLSHKHLLKQKFGHNWSSFLDKHKYWVQKRFFLVYQCCNQKQRFRWIIYDHIGLVDGHQKREGQSKGGTHLARGRVR